MRDFLEAYKQLNAAQRMAVDTIDGPVLIIAGPGTGKTQLLSLRAANILLKDPTVLPSNILCLTFTDNAAANMRERLIRYIGQDAYQVAVHTFNAFGSRIMTMYPEFFNQWREVAVADELTVHRILEELLDNLPPGHVLAGQAYDGTYNAIKQLKNLISDSKRANISPNELRQILLDNQAEYAKAGEIIRSHWPENIRSSDAMVKLEHLCTEISKIDTNKPGELNLTPIKTLICGTLAEARILSSQLEPRSQSKPFTQWKNNWLVKSADGLRFAAEAHYEKLLAAAEMYEEYQKQLSNRAMADFNDQIVTVLEALRANQDLRLALQERFQYVMIDEYQDTNRAQLQMAQFITDATVHEGRPNILVVGDDDQAVFKFQGADLSNVGLFEATYRDPVVITLGVNYRSNKLVIDSALKINSQIEHSFQKLKGTPKPLDVTVETAGKGTELHEFKHESHQYAWIAGEIKRLVDKQQVKGGEIAILGRERAQLDAMVPYLRALKLPIDYERRENILEQLHIVELLNLARLIYALSKQDMPLVNELLPAVLSHAMWGIEPAKLWRVSSAAYRDKKLWMDVIYEQNDPDLIRVANFLIKSAGLAGLLPLEQMLDILIGTEAQRAANTEQEGEETEAAEVMIREFVSPFKSHYFPADLLKKRPTEYLTLLSHLSALRNKLRNYQTSTGQVIYLENCLDFVDSYSRAELLMLDKAPHREDEQAVRLMTVHKAKGLEFDAVFVLGVQDNIWQRSGGGSSRFSYPLNLREFKPPENDLDDALRLLFVGLTRARQDLLICYYKHSEEGKEAVPFGPLLSLGLPAIEHGNITIDPTALAQEYEEKWLKRHASVPAADRRALLKDKLTSYQLSVTHLNNFLNVTEGGPLYFLTQNLLHFPSSMNASAVYGTLIHRALRFAHESYTAAGIPTIKEALDYFSRELDGAALTDRDKIILLKKGREALDIYLKERGQTFSMSQKTEFDFTDQGVVVGGARIKGAIDLIDIPDNNRSVTVIDYKTGKSFSKWELPPSAQEYDRIKLHKYRQQLLFYKLLVDGSAEFGRRGLSVSSGVLQFVEPDNYGKIRQLNLVFNEEDLARLKMLVTAVWNKIQNLEFPDTGTYPATAEGIIMFENDLLKGKI